MTNKDANGVSKATQPLASLRQIVARAQESGRSEQVHEALISVIEGLITHAEKQARAIEDLRSDLSHKQGIVSNIDGRDYDASVGTGAGTPANDELDL